MDEKVTTAHSDKRRDPCSHLAGDLGVATLGGAVWEGLWEAVRFEDLGTLN